MRYVRLEVVRHVAIAGAPGLGTTYSDREGGRGLACYPTSASTPAPPCLPALLGDNRPIDERATWARRRSETEQRRRDAELRYDLEVEFRKVGW